MLTDFEQNSRGLLSVQQKNFLLRTALFRLFLALIGCSIVWGFAGSSGISKEYGLPFSTIGWIMGGVLIIIGAASAWGYGRDMFLNKPIHQAGKLRKYRKKPLRGADYYCIRFDEHQFSLFNVELYTTVELWERLEEGKCYELFFTRHTRWLLSWRLCQADS